MSHEFDPTDLVGQAKAKTKDDDAARLQRKREEDDFKWLMRHQQGRRYVWRLLERTGVYRSSFTGNSETFFREGQRNIGLMVMNDIHELCPDQYNVMVKEQQEHDRSKRDADNGRTS